MLHLYKFLNWSLYDLHVHIGHLKELHMYVNREQWGSGKVTAFMFMHS